ncbi:MAG TPA: hypothetical protein VK196_10865 [Magnetospirillum sp.]|nr:hypothetical protein [Magnetospirillum sp.]
MITVNERCKPVSRRALLFAGAMMPAAAIAAPAPSTPADSAAVLAQQWLALEMRVGQGLTDDEIDAVGDRQSHVGTQLLSTRASTVAGLRAKLEVLVGWLGLPDSLPMGEVNYFNDELLLSLLADARALEQLGS